MSLNVHWFLPGLGDSRNIDGTGHFRHPTVEYLSEVGMAADRLGFEGMLTPVGSWCEDPWIMTSHVAAVTERIKFIVALRPGATAPTLIAQMSGTYQRATSGRLILNIVVGGEEGELRRFGEWDSKEERYGRLDEFLTIFRGCFDGPFDFEGDFYKVEQAMAGPFPVEPPPIFFGGVSEAADRVAAKHVDVQLSWCEPLDAMEERIQRLRGMAADHDRELAFGLRVHAISRDTADEAWNETDRLLAAMDPETVKFMVEAQKTSASEGQRRMAELHKGSTDSDALVVGKNLWAGVGLVRAGAGTALVGSHEEIADRLAEFHEVGITHVILSGHPHLEQAYEVGEGLLPVLRERGLINTEEEVAAA